VKGAWVGNETTAAIKIKTLLGDKFLALDPLGAGPQDPAQPIPLSRTTSPYDVTQAFTGFGQEVSQINTVQLGRSLQTLAAAFAGTPPYVRSALRGLASLSQTVASRDAQLAGLLRGAKNVTGALSDQNANFARLLGDGNLLLAELRQRVDRRLALQALDQVTTVLAHNQANLKKALALAGPYYRLLGNAVGNGRWFDAYLCGILPKSYLPPGTGPSTGCEPPRP